MGCHVALLLHLVEETEGEDGDGGNDCRDLVVRESSWHKTKIFTMSLSQNISFRDKAMLSGRIGRVSTST